MNKNKQTVNQGATRYSLTQTRKGFTLIELLAVIVILAIIALIAVPLILNTIKTAKYGAFKAHKKAIEEAAMNYYSFGYPMERYEGIEYVSVGKLIDEELLKNSNKILSSGEIDKENIVIIFNSKKGYVSSLQIYEDYFMEWYKNEMINGTKQLVKKDSSLLPSNNSTKEISLSDLMDKNYTDELRQGNNLTERCLGNVTITNTNNKYEYIGIVDCGINSSYLASSSVTVGGKYDDRYENVIALKDGGYIAVGSSQSPKITSYGTETKGYNDGLIVKHNEDGTVAWVKTFGGTSHDNFYDVAETDEGDLIVVGYTTSQDGDLKDLYSTGRQAGAGDALIVKYNNKGEIIGSKVHGGSSEQGGDVFYSIKKYGNEYLISGITHPNIKDHDHENVTENYRWTTGVSLIIDQDLKDQQNRLFGGEISDYFFSGIKDKNNDYLFVGATRSTSIDLTNITNPTYTYGSVRSTVIVKYDSDLNIKKVATLEGSGGDYFRDIIEVDNGYIVIGYSSSNDNNFEGLNKGNNDIIIVKYDKDLNIVWKKNFGGTSTDIAYKIVDNGNGFGIIGYTSSTNGDISGKKVNSKSRSDALIMSFDYNGNLKETKTYGGTYNDYFTGVIYSNGNYIAVGYTYSNDINLKGQNKGASDAMLVKLDSNFNPVEDLKERVVLVEKVKSMALLDNEKYGTTLNSSVDGYEQIYTTNDPTTDLGTWCSSYKNVGVSYNYKYGECLKPINPSSIATLFRIAPSDTIKTEEPNTITFSATKNKWIRFHLYSYSGTISNFKIHYEDDSVSSIRESVESKKIQPLVVISGTIASLSANYYYTNALGIIEPDGNVGTYVGTGQLNILFKPKENIVGISFDLSTNFSGTYNSITVYQYNDFDMSITPVK